MVIATMSVREQVTSPGRLPASATPTWPSCPASVPAMVCDHDLSAALAVMSAGA